MRQLYSFGELPGENRLNLLETSTGELVVELVNGGLHTLSEFGEDSLRITLKHRFEAKEEARKEERQRKAGPTPLQLLDEGKAKIVKDGGKYRIEELPRRGKELLPFLQREDRR